MITTQIMTFFIENFFSKCDQNHRKLFHFMPNVKKINHFMHNVKKWSNIL